MLLGLSIFKRNSSIRQKAHQIQSFSIGSFRSFYVDSQYCIKKGYRHRKHYLHYNDIGKKDQYQKEVYEIAKETARLNNFRKVIDVGCGSAYKLLKYFSEDYETIGIEIEGTYQYLLKNYPNYAWLNGKTVDYSQLDADMIICADVIEHVVDPTYLLTQIKMIKNVKKIFLSTPDRLLARGWFDYGPPKNKTHIREWSGKEFYNYISREKFNISNHQISNYSTKTQLIICSPQ